jgi:hypothetical protein
MEATPTLAEIQSWLSARILNTASASAARIDGGITPARDADTRERLAVYVDGYPARLEEALVEAFPAVAHVIGATETCALVRRFAAAARLRSYNLNDAGADLPRLLRTDPITERLPFLPDLAELEWRVLRAFHAAGAEPFDPAPMAGWDSDAWSRAVLQFQPWVAVVSSDWPIHHIWELRETPVDEIDLALDGKPAHVLVRRQQFSVVCEPIEACESQALHLLLAGLPLGIVMETLSARGTAAEAIGEWFQHWVVIGLVQAVRLAG